MANPLNHRSAFEQQTRLQALLVQNWGKRLEINAGGGKLIVSLEADIQSTWQSAVAGLHLTTDNNIVFASDQQENEKPCILTYVVGSALKVTGAHNPDELYALMMGIGVDSRDAWLVADHCEGLDLGMVWSFYRDRHDFLIAVPLMNTEFAASLMSSDG
ncbi:hypothetical protein KQ302_11355 [Synechococcus sp. CS-602]|uniref:hypothetical protein n=1 Tax=Synechococcaceae TaxID=1890426 RepID=UPI000B18E571|nr:MULTISPECIES: hypothetical protein [Synechococcaceae]MCT4365897.1 hypothetical protein [Candidatus Regnicoccus frigidus MAG-AL1]MCT0201744.1 hypothetical protein [Synechococcus sp. CS-603]MCT0205686.1 hypothetical protein [Synechococcus sp. CS-602]MCT0247047.1 hypothetical protein [Synechococcus sp. CS-601]MCT4367231.1 hypothetical protein [Candidatus Regnicoccus frigidus MAG-AL2]